MADDQGGVTRDMFSGFWKEAYITLFDGVTLLIPLVHPQTDLQAFSTLGKIMSHGYLVSTHCSTLTSMYVTFHKY